MPRVSVIVPTYNRAASLSDAIDSALAQTVSDIEVVVVDDGSTDETASVLADYDDARVRPVVHATNQGANVARNTGIEHARGDYVAFLDSDDRWHPEKLERQLAALNGRSDDWVGVYCDTAYDLAGASGRLRTAVASLLETADADPTTEGGEELAAEILADDVQPAAGSTLLVRTEVASAVNGWNERLDRFQDPEFCLRVLEERKLAYVDEELVVREETGQPPADVVSAASEQYRSLYAESIDRFETEGYEIHATHELVCAKAYLAEGRLLRGLWHLRDARIERRQYPGVCWAAGTGLRHRPIPFVATMTVTLLAVLIARYTVVQRTVTE